MGSNNSKGGGGHGSQPMAMSGQLGRGGGEAAAPVVWGLQQQAVAQVASGRYHSLALTRGGRVYTWGLNDHGQLGRPARSDGAPCTSGATCCDGVPAPVPALAGVVAIAAGRYNSMALDRHGRLWVWGYDGCGGVAGLPPPGARHVPRAVSGALSHARVVAFDAGYTFWIAADEAGKAFTCGTGDDGYAGTLPSGQPPNHHGELGRTGNPLVPLQVEHLAAEEVVAVAAGRHHAVVCTAQGRVFSWGGRAGASPQQLAGDLADARILYVAAGEYFSLAASATAVYGWGLRAYAGLNGSSETHTAQPEVVLGALAPPRWTIVGLAAGYQHAFALVLPRENRASGTPSHPAQQAVPATVQAPAGHGTAGLANVSHTDYLAQAALPNQTVAGYWQAYANSSRHDIIAATSPDVFQMLPKTYDERYRNPCWWAGDKFLCLPYFHILGVSKCGTTDLYHRLVKHPDMLESRNKGPHFWDECQYPPTGACTVPPSGDFEGYVELFADAATAMLSHAEAITGEASSNTFTATNGVYLRGFTAPRFQAGVNVTMAELLREVQPYLRLIVMFRDPADRYYSAHHYYRRKEPPDSAEEVHRAAVADLAAWDKCVRSKGQEQCVRMYHPQQLVKGMYSEFIQDWLKHWPREQLLFLRLEDYHAATKPHLAAVFRFLGMAQPTKEQWPKILEMPTRNSQRHRYPKMLPETRALLNSLYQPFNAKLQHILQDPRWAWHSQR